MKTNDPNTAKNERPPTQRRSPIFYGASGCTLGFMIMVIFATVAILVGISGQTYGTIVSVGAWVLPIGLGVFGYFYGKSRQ